jgi:3-oxoadipate enol-lactonase
VSEMGAGGLAASITEPPDLEPAARIDLPGRGSLPVRDIGPADAPAVMMLHGWTVTADLNYFGQYPALCDRYRVIAFDHAGHGSGLRPRRRVSVKSLADDAVAVADALGVNTFVPFGYSLGGAVAQVMARNHPDRLAGLVLAATLPRFRASDLRLWPGIMFGTAAATRVVPDALVDRVFGRMLARRTAGLHPWGVDQLKHNEPRILLEVGSSLFNHDSREWLPQVTVPTAVVVTEDDTKVRPQNQRAIADLIPGTTLHPVPGEHDAPVTAPTTFNVGLLDALDSVLSRSADG